MQWLCPGAKLAAAAALAAVLVCGCAAGQWGRLETDTGITQMFENNRVPKDFRYYVCGRPNMPYAIVGLDPAYTFDMHLWEEVTPNNRDFAHRVDFIWEPRVWDRFDSGRGARILDPGGNPIGIWYSMYPNAAIQIDAQKQRVIVFCPHRASEANF